MPVMTKMRDSMPVVFAVLAGIFLLMIIFQWGGQGTLFAPKGEAGVLGSSMAIRSRKGYNKILETVTADMKSKNKVTEPKRKRRGRRRRKCVGSGRIRMRSLNRASRKWGLSSPDENSGHDVQ